MVISHIKSKRGNGNFRTLLLACFTNRTPIVLVGQNGETATGIISSLCHEDGSGYSYLIGLEGDSQEHYMRTVDLSLTGRVEGEAPQYR